MLAIRIFVLAVFASATHALAADKATWPQWRGPLGTGVSPSANPPVAWSETQNLRWKLAVPGKGHSTPVVWGDVVFLTTADPVGEAMTPRPDPSPGAHDNVSVTHRYAFKVLAVSRRTGTVLWEQTVASDLPHEGGHYTASQASASPCTDGEFVYASFGSRGVYALGMDGKMQWRADLGRMYTKHGHGEGSSPLLHGDLLVVNADHEGESFLVALDKRTGTERWRVARDEVTSWSSPAAAVVNGQAQVIVNGTDRMRGYDLETGSVIWACGGLSANVVATPVVGNGMVYAASSYDTRAMLAVRLDGAKGDVTGTDHVVWTRTRGTPYVPSPLLYGNALYFLRHYQGILTRVDALTGEERPGPMRLPEIRDVYASPIGAASRVYVTSREGVTVVLSHSDRPEVLAVNRLDDTFSASAVPVGRDLILRGEKFLYCLGE